MQRLQVTPFQSTIYTCFAKGVLLCPGVLQGLPIVTALVARNIPAASDAREAALDRAARYGVI